MRSPEHALALQSAFKGVLDTPKLPINCTSGRDVTRLGTQLGTKLDTMLCTKLGITLGTKLGAKFGITLGTKLGTMLSGTKPVCGLNQASDLRSGCANTAK